MKNQRDKQFTGKVKVLSCLCLFPASVFAVSSSPWQVTDGSTLSVTSGYNATAKGDYGLYSTGAGSVLETAATGLVFSSTYASTNVLQATQGGTAILKGATLQSSGASSSVVNAQGGNVSITDGTIISNASGTAWGVNGQSGADITLKDTQITYTSGVSGSGIKLTASTLAADNLALTSNGSAAASITGKSDATFNQSTIAAQDSAIGISSSGASTSARASVKLDNSAVTTQNATGIRGIYTDIDLTDSTVETHGNAAHALDINVGSQADISGGSYQTRGSKSFGAWLVDSGSVLNASQASFITTGDGSHAISAQKGMATLDNDTLQTSGDDAYGLYSETTVSGDRLAITTFGAQGIGAFASRGGEINVKNSVISTYGANGAGALAYPQSTVILDNSTITTAGENAYGLWDYAGTITASNSSITTQGNAAALYASGYSDTLSNNVSLTDVSLTSQKAQAVDALATTLNLNVTNSELTGGNNQSLTVRSAEQEGTGYYSTVNVAAQNSVLNGDIISDSQQNQVDVALTSASVLNGAVEKIDSLAVDPTSIWNVSGDSDLTTLTNNGTVAFASDGQARTVTVAGNYRGDGGTLVLNSVLGDDNSQTDKLIIQGDVESGTTRTTVNNLGGQGAQTVEGIEVVSVGGTSYGSFVKSGRIVAGAYDYDLVKKNQNWYLTSSTDATDPDEGGNNGGDGGDGGNTGGNEGGGTETTSVYRPEGGALLANQQAANTLFATTLNDREGARYQSTGDHGAGMWLRQVGNHTRFHDGSGQIKTQSNSYVAQLGADLAQWQFTDSDRLYVGFMTGYGHNSSRSQSSISQYSAKGRVSGYSVGPYATWYQDIVNRRGGYLDSWVLYNHFDNKVSGQGLNSEEYKSKGVLASLEGGYSIKLTDNGRESSWVMPKGQLIWSNIMADDYHEANGTKVRQRTNTNAMTRLGVRAYLRGHSTLDDNTGRQFQPFVEANWVHNTHNWRVMMDDVTMNSEGSRNLGEVKVGVEGHIAESIDLWGNVTQQVGDKGYSSTTGMAGVKYRF